MYSKITKDEIIKAIDTFHNLAENSSLEHKNWYLSWNTFLKLFSKAYDLFYFDGIDWYIKGANTRIVLSYSVTEFEYYII